MFSSLMQTAHTQSRSAFSEHWLLPGLAACSSDAVAAAPTCPSRRVDECLGIGRAKDQADVLKELGEER